MVRKLTKFASQCVLPDAVNFWDDFILGAAEDAWTAGGTGTNALSTTVGGGVIDIAVTGGADNTEKCLVTPAFFDPTVDEEVFELFFRVKYTEANTDDANICLGLVEDAAALLENNGGGLETDDEAIALVKLDGETRWRLQVTDGSSLVVNKELDLPAGSGVWQTLGIRGFVDSSDKMNLTVWADGDSNWHGTAPSSGESNLFQVREYGADVRVPALKVAVDLSSFSEILRIGMAVKNGGANNETLSVDYVSFSSARE